MIDGIASQPALRLVGASAAVLAAATSAKTLFSSAQLWTEDRPRFCGCTMAAAELHKPQCVFRASGAHEFEWRAAASKSRDAYHPTDHRDVLDSDSALSNLP